ncbi:MAG: Hpt domain-containing protein [Bacteroidetes bacterium]|nr:Hpt domain-containing protein [Bacteroidota bacterium]
MNRTIKHSENMLVRGEELDRLLLLAGEVIITSSNQGLVYKNLQDLFDKKVPVDQEALDAAKDLASSTSLLSGDLHWLVQSIRTVNLKDMGFRSRRLVRDLSRKTGKLINFEVRGEETTIDKAIVDQLYDPIAHQLRNAVDHGIEDVQTRERLGKPQEGRIVFNVYNTDQETVIEIEDDGAGVPLQELHNKGIESGIISKDDPIKEEIALELMCTPGLTTSETVSKISGRGVGMDVVRNSIDNLGGTFYFKTTAGQGTTFTFRIPLASAVNIVDALVVGADENIFAFPISNVVASIALSKEDITSALEKGEMVKYLDSLLPLHDLNHVLDKRCADFDWAASNGNIPILIIEHKGKRVAFKVTEFLAPQKLVIIPFDESIAATGLVGSTILGGRKLGYIVDVPALISLALDEKVRGVTRKVRGKDSEQTTETAAASEQERPAGDAFTEDPYDTHSEVSAAAKQEYVTELERLFPDLNEAVFAIESDPSDNEKVHAAFRLFHTIKGNFIMMGLPKGGETIHGIESVLDSTRSGKMEITPEVMDIIMDGVSYIEDVVRNMQAGTWEDKAAEDIVERSTSLLPEKSFEQQEIEDVAEAEIRLTHESQYRALMHRKNNSKFYRIYIEFDPGGQPSFLVACLIYRRICDVGDVLGTVPLLADIEKGMMDGKIKLLFTSPHDQDFLQQVLEELFTKHYGASLVSLTISS